MFLNKTPNNRVDNSYLKRYLKISTSLISPVTEVAEPSTFLGLVSIDGNSNSEHWTNNGSSQFTILKEGLFFINASVYYITPNSFEDPNQFNVQILKKNSGELIPYPLVIEQNTQYMVNTSTRYISSVSSYIHAFSGDILYIKVRSTPNLEMIMQTYDENIYNIGTMIEMAYIHI